MEKKYRKMTRKASGKVREIGEGDVVLELPLSVAEVMEGIPVMVKELSEAVGLMVISALMTSECEGLAGKKNTKNPKRDANWWGSELSPIYYNRQKVLIERPRIRSKDNKEIPLNTYKAFRDAKGMRSSVMKQMVLGISTRNYEEAVENLIKGYGIKKSSISRHFVKATSGQMEAIIERDLSGLSLCGIFIDGIDFKGQMLVVALGLGIDGNKQVLGLWQGATENGEVCKMLLEDMVRRGLDTSRNYIFILDGSKALRSSVARVFGEDVTVQRCQMHKRRNVKGHLPPKHQSAIDTRIKAAYNMASYEEAKESLELTVKYLDKINPSAANSLREGLEETLTIHKLGIAGLLRKTLSTTNPIESCFSVTRTVTKRVKRWREGDMRQRWAVAALLRAEKKFNRINGYKDIPKLIAALQQKTLDKKDAAA
ncbi:MAG: IS256 family transposase [Candidatus Magnetominusculus sp. LBB02]|nr:IS256 family transposase [Candidatus Magnetominusculus sp. LBB02]